MIPKYSASTHDMTKRVLLRNIDACDNASQRFQRLVDRCLEDGSITRSEAIMLVQKHNAMQEVSRESLKQLLKNHGNYPASTLLVDRHITTDGGVSVRHDDIRGDTGVQGRPQLTPLTDIDFSTRGWGSKPKADLTYATKSATRGKGSKNWTPGVQKLDTVHNKDTLKDILVSAFADQHVRFALITVPAAFFSLLKFTGVF